MLGLPVAAGAKERINDEKVIITSIIGDVAGRNVIVLDDEIARGTTIIELLGKLREHGARSVRIACTHGLFCDGALKRIAAWPEVEQIVCTNTVAIPASEQRREAARDLGGAGARRGDQADPRGRVGQRPVRSPLTRHLVPRPHSACSSVPAAPTPRTPSLRPRPLRTPSLRPLIRLRTPSLRPRLRGLLLPPRPLLCKAWRPAIGRWPLSRFSAHPQRHMASLVTMPPPVAVSPTKINLITDECAYSPPEAKSAHSSVACSQI